MGDNLLHRVRRKTKCLKQSLLEFDHPRPGTRLSFTSTSTAASATRPSGTSVAPRGWSCPETGGWRTCGRRSGCANPGTWSSSSGDTSGFCPQSRACSFFFLAQDRLERLKCFFLVTTLMPSVGFASSSAKIPLPRASPTPKSGQPVQSMLLFRAALSRVHNFVLFQILPSPPPEWQVPRADSGRRRRRRLHLPEGGRGEVRPAGPQPPLLHQEGAPVGAGGGQAVRSVQGPRGGGHRHRRGREGRNRDGRQKEG